MARITIRDVLPYNGDFDVDLSYFTNAELHGVRELTGLRPTELVEALQMKDAGLVVALARIALERHGHEVFLEPLWNAKGGHIVIDLTDDEETPSPPTSPSPSDSKPDGNGNSSDEKRRSSGSASESDGDD